MVNFEVKKTEKKMKINKNNNNLHEGEFPQWQNADCRTIKT